MAASIPSSTLAVTHRPSRNKALALETLPVPVPAGPEEHLIRVRAVAITNGELGWSEPRQQDDPVPGYEMAGTVAAAPPGSPFPAGSRVYARTALGRQGSARTYTIALAGELGRAPRGIDPAEAATVPLSALTAWQALFVHGGFGEPAPTPAPTPDSGAAPGTPGQSVLVTAAAGGVGMFAVQLARLAGISRVVGTCGTNNVDFARGLGAHEVLDYRAGSGYLAALGGERFDLVLDCVGGGTLAEVWKLAKPGGVVISVAEPAEAKRPASGVAESARTRWFIVDANGGQLGRITQLIEAGKLKTAVDSVYPFDEFEQAFAKAQSGHARGKVVLVIPDDV